MWIPEAGSAGMECSKSAAGSVEGAPPLSAGAGVRAQVMSPMKKGPSGTRSLNRRLQALLNPPSHDKPELPRRAWSLDERASVFRLGDRVIQVC